MKEKRVLVVERSGSDISYSNETVTNNLGKQEESIVLTGIFTTFNQKNRNGRIYESADFLPHIEALKESIKNHTLLGELDHPHGFEISLTNASHVIESLDYDPQRNVVVGKIRLLNTAKGKDAQALVRDGIPLHISSRAAGTVDESGHVKLQQLFTYDLVADPGFANAVLSRVNEGVDSNPISDESRRILTEMKEKYEKLNEGLNLIQSSDDCEIYETNTELLPEPGQEGFNTDRFGAAQQNQNANKRATNGTIDDTNNNNNMDNGKYISFEDFQKYTENLSEIIADLQSAIANYKTELDSVKKEKEGIKPTETFEDGKTDNSAISALVADEINAKVSEVQEKYNNLKKYTMYLAEQLDKSISHQDYIVENANDILKKQDEIIKHNNYIVDNLNDTIGYQNYIAEMLDKSIDYSNMLAEEQNKNIAHSDYLVEKMNQMIRHQDYIAESCNNIIEEGNKLNEKFEQLKSHNNYIVEGMNNIVAHNDYIVESINSKEENALNEENKVVRENNKPTENQKPEQKTDENKEEKFNSKKYQSEINEKLGNLISTVKTHYEETKKKEVEQIAESKKAIENSNEFMLVNYIPERLKEKWANLSDERKQEILAESKMLVIKDANTATYFWNTRDMREKRVEMKKVEEQVTANHNNNPVNEGLSDRQKMMSEMIKYRMRK
jgi:Sec-independent protein translocase protein TatA